MVWEWLERSGSTGSFFLLFLSLNPKYAWCGLVLEGDFTLKLDRTYGDLLHSEGVWGTAFAFASRDTKGSGT